ncbi:hypothetical protein FRC07_006153 [Ceratobasidium sp. 392]|nr:hypothetical protein FRC07_006153 [Ceratobasidium sp. 392]
MSLAYGVEEATQAASFGEQARLLLQHHFFPPLPPDSALLNPTLLASAHIIELGSGTGILGCALPPLLSTGRITLTDLPELVPLLRKNAKSDKVSVEALDWTWPMLPSFSADLVLCVDCIYNTALVRPLVRVLSMFDAPILVLIELRDEDVVRAFLEEWLNWEATSAGDDLDKKKFQLWRIADGLLDPHFAAWDIIILATEAMPPFVLQHSKTYEHHLSGAD